MSEKMRLVESGVEKSPNEREVMQKVDSILEGRGYTVLKQVEDDEGLSRLDMASSDSDGQRLDISYTRDRVTTDGEKIPTIHQTLYYGDMPVGAGTQYDYVGLGEWKEIP